MPDQTPNDHQDDHQNNGWIAGSHCLQEHPKLYGREEEQVNIAFLKKKKKEEEEKEGGEEERGGGEEEEEEEEEEEVEEEEEEEEEEELSYSICGLTVVCTVWCPTSDIIP